MAEIGARLREARMRAKIDINEVEVSTKIRAKYLRAIENEEWDLLPGEVYVKSFLRTYGEYLGLDTRQLVDDFKRRYERPSDNELQPIVPLGRDRERARGPLLPPWVIVGFVLVVIAAVLWVVGNGSKQKTAPPTANHAGVVHRAHRPKPHRAKTKLPVTLTTVRLQLVPIGQVYVCRVTGSGRKLIPGQIFDTGQTIPVQKASKLLLTLGNANIKLKVNGVNMPIAPSSSAIGYEFLPGSHRTLTASQQPTCA